MYRIKDGFPSVPNSHKSQLPLLLSQNPDIVHQIISFCRSNISTLTIDAVHQHVHDTILPNLAETIKKERNLEVFDCEMLKKEYRLKTLSHQTIFNWMQKLGFHYKPRKKSYYVDTHERPENVHYKMAFIRRYFEYEIRAHRWISIPKAESMQMVANGEIECELH